jgi:hypothetical protein
MVIKIDHFGGGQLVGDVKNGCLNLWVGILLALCGCTSISVDPECPSELTVGESGSVWANEREPGEIPTYLWEAIPSGAGTFADPTALNTSFKAEKEGEAVLRLTASDGLYQAVGECRTTIVASVNVAVALQIDPSPVVVGETAILFCSSVGETEAVTRTLEQVDGATVTLAPLSEGVATFVSNDVGDLTFSCTGATEAGQQSQPSVAAVSVVTADDNGDRPARPGR